MRKIDKYGGTLSMRKIIIIRIIALILFIILLKGCVQCISGDLHRAVIETEYGDSFTVSCDMQHKWILKDNNSLFYARLSNYYDIEDGIVGFYCTEDLRCYNVGGKIIYKSTDSDSFEVFYGDFSTNEEMIPAMKKILLYWNGRELEEYISFYMKESPDETEEVLRNFMNANYEPLYEWGLTEEMIQNEELLKCKKEIVESFLE